MVTIIELEGRKSFINDMIEKSKEGIDYIVINEPHKNKDYLLVDGVINTPFYNDIIDDTPSEKTKIIVDSAECKTLEESALTDLKYSLRNDIVVITNNKNILKSI